MSFFVLSKNGQRALDVEVNSIGDPSVKVQDLEDSRREIIALSGVPAPLTNIAALVSNDFLNNLLNSVELLYRMIPSQEIGVETIP
jgi:hypothetical protein